MNLVAATPEDIPQITAWMQADIDPAHRTLGADFWLTGSAFMTGKIQDDGGVAAYYRVEHEGDGFRLHIQFAPESVVSKRRVIVTGIEFMRFMVFMARAENKKFIITESASPRLIGFMKKIGFKDSGQNNDFVLQVA